MHIFEHFDFCFFTVLKQFILPNLRVLEFFWYLTPLEKINKNTLFLLRNADMYNEQPAVKILEESEDY